MRILLKVAITAVALWVSTVLIEGITLGDQSTGRRIVTLLAVAVIFGLVNAILKPVIKTLGCAFYVLTLGLIGLVVNALLLWLTSELAQELDLPFHVTGFWPAFWGAIVVGVVGWLLHVLVPDGKDKDDD
ncbi:MULTISPECIES: phage holin family protein [Actinomadura]|uniref:phage holin family protein n=1 Tax=Actinomadura TaxID=1988 RepID=UPI0003ACE944|nr:phage holin family protein [Actinomadura madurae]MCP9968383.1 phage holin family protein [Actinomadura madurae]MCP9980850.1 phage holin family protein [Actinomadura madurae]MCQ0007652.1 phage holin family protein [Actinomadura madurae]URM97329.1 phage holin family protein [Actinomadura madurae]URN08095.1 phage holin family protein [Actinomadura madurae]